MNRGSLNCEAMEHLPQRFVTDKKGNAHLLYVLGLLALAIISQPSVAKALVFQAHDLWLLFVGQFLSLI